MHETINEFVRDPEVVIELVGGWSLRSGSRERQAGDYVRLCSPDGSQRMRWESDAWKMDPIRTVGDILTSCVEIAGSGFKIIDGCSVRLMDGATIRSGAGKHCGEYLSLHEGIGDEVSYYDHAEWARDPVLVIGAFFQDCAGLRFVEQPRASA